MAIPVKLKSNISRSDNDARLIISFKENDVEAMGTFLPSTKGGECFTREYIDKVILENNITCGIQEESIDFAIKKCNEENIAIGNILIARGTPPVNEVHEHSKLNPTIAANLNIRSDNKKSDFLKADNLIMVRKDQVLAKQEQFKPGKNGINVHGAEVQYEVLKPAKLNGGKNTRAEGSLLVSDINGQLIYDDGLLQIEKDVEIEGDVGSHKSGSVIFPGNININGSVANGSKVLSGASVFISKNAEFSELIAGKDLVAGGALIGHGLAQIKVSGSLSAKSIENCQVICKGKMTIASEIKKAGVFCLDTVEGVRCKILGGEVWAVNGIRAAAIHKYEYSAAKIHCGIDPVSEHKKEKYNRIISIISAKLSKINNKLAEDTLDEAVREKLITLRDRLKEEQKAAGVIVMEKLDKIRVNENAKVEIYGEIAAGTLIEICKVALFVNRPLAHVRIYLDKKHNELVVENL